jgi:hypothetical protein
MVPSPNATHLDTAAVRRRSSRSSNDARGPGPERPGSSRRCMLTNGGNLRPLTSSVSGESGRRAASTLLLLDRAGSSQLGVVADSHVVKQNDKHGPRAGLLQYLPT